MSPRLHGNHTLPGVRRHGLPAVTDNQRLGSLLHLGRVDRLGGIERHISKRRHCVVETPAHGAIIRYEIEDAEPQRVGCEHGFFEALALIAVGEPHALASQAPTHLAAGQIVMIPLAIADAESNEGQVVKFTGGTADALATSLEAPYGLTG